jgi:hypothetical protein
MKQPIRRRPSLTASVCGGDSFTPPGPADTFTAILCGLQKFTDPRESFRLDPARALGRFGHET